MPINYLAVLACGVLSMVIGSIWYGPLFGKKWGEIIGADKCDDVACKKTQKSVGHLYLLQFVLTLLQAYVLAYYIRGFKEISGLENALWVWAAFIMPIVAGGSMWNNDSRKMAWARFLIQAGYQFILFVSFGLILGFWR